MVQFQLHTNFIQKDREIFEQKGLLSIHTDNVLVGLIHQQIENIHIKLQTTGRILELSSAGFLSTSKERQQINRQFILVVMFTELPLLWRT